VKERLFCYVIDWCYVRRISLSQRGFNNRNANSQVNKDFSGQAGKFCVK
jgi:hypothetical protein